MAITIDLSSLGDGTYTIEDDGTPGNGTSVVRDPLGNIVTTFAHPADAVTILSRAGQSLNINITDSLTTAAFTVGNIDNAFAGQRPDSVQIGGVLTSGAVTLTANQTINEWGSDGATDIVAGALLMRAGTGVGTGGNFIETQVSAMEAESTTGGIAISNINDVALSVASAAGNLLRGLWTGSGNITLINQGSILLSDNNGIESVRSGGNLQLTAIGASADISSNVNRDALLAVGNITLSSGRDVLFGTVGADFDNDVRAGGSITITAGRDFHIDGFSDMAADDQGLATNGGVSITAGRDILIEDDNGVDASVGVTAVASTGSVVLTTGAFGTLSLAANSSAAIQGRNGGVVINADRLLIENDSGINVSGTGSVRLTGSTAGRLIALGSVTDGVTALELSDAELDRIVASNVIVGSASSGQVSVVGAITHANNNLTIESGTDVLVQADITTPATLTVRSGDDFTQTAASFITTGTLNIFVDTPDLDGPGGINAFLGAFALTDATVQGSADADTLVGLEGVAQTVSGYGGSDTIHSSGEGSYFGGSGDDTIFAGQSSGVVAEVLDGGSGSDTLITTIFTGDYVIDLATGVTNFAFESFVNFENLTTGTGNDKISGTSANNVLSGGNGADQVGGRGGDDKLNGGAGADQLVGGAGNDELNGGSGADTMTGGLDNDVYYVDNAGDTVTELVGEGIDRVIAQIDYTLAAEVENLTLSGALVGTGNDLANVLRGTLGDNTLSGLAGNDELFGNEGDDSLHGGGGNDRLEGAAGRDTLSGANGDDQLVGGTQKDTLFGGDGTDTFFFADGEVGATASSADIILDFDQTEGDRINVRRIDADTGLAGDQNFTFIGTGAFTATAGELRYSQAGGNLFVEGDTNGDGAADFVIRVDGLQNLTAADFVL